MGVDSSSCELISILQMYALTETHDSSSLDPVVINNTVEVLPYETILSFGHDAEPGDRVRASQSTLPPRVLRVDHD